MQFFIRSCIPMFVLITIALFNLDKVYSFNQVDEDIPGKQNVEILIEDLKLKIENQENRLEHLEKKIEENKKHSVDSNELDYFYVAKSLLSFLYYAPYVLSCGKFKLLSDLRYYFTYYLFLNGIEFINKSKLDKRIYDLYLKYDQDRKLLKRLGFNIIINDESRMKKDI